MSQTQNPLLLLFLLVLSIAGYTQDASTIKVVMLTDHLYKIEFFDGFDANMIVSVGEDGLLLVDTGFKTTAGKLKSELKKLGDDHPKYIISTHEHLDHIGGNSSFGKGPVIIGHKNLRTRMQGDDYIYEEYPEYALPEITFVDSLSLYFNGEEIRIISIAGSHTDNDIMVHFTKSGYAYLGDLAYGQHIPSVDFASGDDSKYGEAVKHALDLLPDDTRFVSGHGRDLTMAEMREWQHMLEETIATIKAEMDKGKDIKTMQDENILANWKKYTVGGYVSTNAWIENVVNGFKGIVPPRTPEAAYYYAYKAGGLDSLKQVYREVRNSEHGDSKWQPVVLYGFAYYLMDHQKYEEAIKFFSFCITEYPELYYMYDGLGEAFMKSGNKKEAIANYNKSLELEPKNTNASKMVEIINK